MEESRPHKTWQWKSVPCNPKILPGIFFKVSRGLRKKHKNLLDGRAALYHPSWPFLSAAAPKPLDGLDRRRTQRRAFPELERAHPERVLQRQRARPYDRRARRLHSQQLRTPQFRFRPDPA